MKKLLVLAAAAATMCTAMAQSFPTKPITFVVPFAAGGPTDKVARDLAVAITKAIPDSSFMVENVNGAGGTIGATKVAKATRHQEMGGMRETSVNSRTTGETISSDAL